MMKCPRCKSTDVAVTVRNGNYSKFNGRRFQYSDYSALTCCGCGWPWRSKAKGVLALPDWSPEAEARYRAAVGVESGMQGEETDAV